MRALALIVVGLLLAPATSQARVLVFTKTTGFRHDSIPAGVAALRGMGFAVDHTEDPARFTSRRLARYEAVVFLSATGNPVARTSQRRALQRYIAHGGGFLGVHAASDAGDSWPWYRGLVGARFLRHKPGTSSAVVTVSDTTSAATAGLPRAWRRTDEWYEFRADPSPHVHVLASVFGHPIAWCHRYGGGRSVYTGMGHTIASYSEPRFVRHLRGALQMAAGRAKFNCAPAGRANFSRGRSGAAVRWRTAP
jgi:type 1 glutamine amidotransferase